MSKDVERVKDILGRLNLPVPKDEKIEKDLKDAHKLFDPKNSEFYNVSIPKCSQCESFDWGVDNSYMDASVVIVSAICNNCKRPRRFVITLKDKK